MYFATPDVYLMPRRKNIKQKKTFEFTYDRYLESKIDYIMSSGLFDTRADAVRAALCELADRIKHGEYPIKES